MQLKTKILKNISLVATLLFALINTQAQKIKIDGVAVVIGKNIVLNSDITKFKKEVELRSEGKIKFSDCEMLEQLMEQKLLAHHAVIDSVVVSQKEIDGRVDRSLQFFTQQYGNTEKVLKAYGFSNMEELKKELGKIQKENLLIEKEQHKITEKIDVTPEEVRIYYNGLKEKNELPEFPAEIELAQIVMYAKPTKEAENKVVEKLNKLREEIKNGASFKLKAIINSDDPAVAQNGGKYTITKDSPFIKEFKETAFSLEEGEISKPFKTDFGYHIIKLHKIKGKQRVASHILMQPEISDIKLEQAKNRLNKLRLEILSGKSSFEKAAKKYSEDKDTKNNGGLIVNPYTGESKFELTRMDPALYGRVNELKTKEITEPFYDETRGGEKMYKIIIMKNKTEPHTADLQIDYVKIKDLALTKKKEETIEKWAREKIEETYIKLGKEYRTCQFKKDWKKSVN